MNTKSVSSLFFILTLLFFSRSSLGSGYADMAIADYFTGHETAVASPGIPYSDAETNSSIVTAPREIEKSVSIASPPYYPDLYYKEYFYRDRDNQPIRDFRYYNIKTQPNYEYPKKNVPLRDFRFEYWKNKEYR